MKTQHLTASDLMMGDWVTFSDLEKGDAIIPIQICAIEFDSVFGFIEHHKAADELDFESLAPIPLTPEILEKNGFNEQGKGENYTDYVFVPTIEGAPAPILVCFYKKPIEGVSILFKCTRSVCNGGGINDLHLCTLNYVHELQHALRLCGIDKEITLD